MFELSPNFAVPESQISVPLKFHSILGVPNNQCSVGAVVGDTETE